MDLEDTNAANPTEDLQKQRAVIDDHNDKREREKNIKKHGDTIDKCFVDHVELSNELLREVEDSQVCVKVMSLATARFLVWHMLNGGQLTKEAEELVSSAMINAGVGALNKLLQDADAATSVIIPEDAKPNMMMGSGKEVQ